MLTRRQIIQSSGMLLPWYLTRGATSATAAASDRMIVHGTTPMNAEPPLPLLEKSWITPNELFYIRSHAPAPQIDPAQFRLVVDGLVERPLNLSLMQLQSAFEPHAQIATLTCAGNRRVEHSLVKQIKGVPWQAGAIGNAEWLGTSLADVLRKAGVKSSARHVWFEGLDEIVRSSGTIPFGASIPLKKAMATGGQGAATLLAYQMNDAPLTADHGFPLRTVVPGYIGARSVKWLGRITVSDRPSPNHYVATAYKLVTEGTDEEWSQAEPIGPYAINSVTCTPVPNTRLQAGRLTVSGYALPAGHADRLISKVEVSADGGTSWANCTFTGPAQPFCWRLWKTELTVSAATTSLLVRATDSSGEKQPTTVPWNLKGYLFNAWHKTAVKVR